MRRKTLFMGTLFLLGVWAGIVPAEHALHASQDHLANVDVILAGSVKTIERKDGELTLKIKVTKSIKGKGTNAGDVITAKFRDPISKNPFGKVGKFIPDPLEVGQDIRAFLRPRKDGKVFDILWLENVEPVQGPGSR